MKLNIIEFKSLMIDFIQYCVKYLALEGSINIDLVQKPKFLFESSNNKIIDESAGCMDRNTGHIIVKIKNRAVADIMRTIAHELTHLKQKQLDMLDDVSIKTKEEEQALEDQANIMSGRLVRWFGQQNPNIYNDID